MCYKAHWLAVGYKVCVCVYSLTHDFGSFFTLVMGYSLYQIDVFKNMHEHSLYEKNTWAACGEKLRIKTRSCEFIPLNWCLKAPRHLRDANDWTKGWSEPGLTRLGLWILSRKCEAHATQRLARAFPSVWTKEAWFFLHNKPYCGQGMKVRCLSHASRF